MSLSMHVASKRGYALAASVAPADLIAVHAGPGAAPEPARNGNCQRSVLTRSLATDVRGDGEAPSWILAKGGLWTVVSEAANRREPVSRATVRCA